MPCWRELIKLYGFQKPSEKWKRFRSFPALLAFAKDELGTTFHVLRIRFRLRSWIVIVFVFFRESFIGHEGPEKHHKLLFENSKIIPGKKIFNEDSTIDCVENSFLQKMHPTLKLLCIWNLLLHLVAPFIVWWNIKRSRFISKSHNIHNVYFTLSVSSKTW